jgi:biopolymer transport protein ExbD
MNFFIKRRPRPVLQIISMIDILIILLIFLVVTTTFKEAQSSVSISLPKSEALATGGTPEARLGLIVTKDEKIYLGETPVLAADLVSALQSAKQTRPDVKLELRIDEKVPFGTLISVWESLKNAGYKMNDVPARVMKP